MIKRMPGKCQRLLKPIQLNEKHQLITSHVQHVHLVGVYSACGGACPFSVYVCSVLEGSSLTQTSSQTGSQSAIS